MKIYFKISALVFCISILCSSFASAQKTCDCSQAFQKLVDKVETDYIGYTLTKNEIGEAYRAHVNQYSELTKTTFIASCMTLLQRFLEFFKDGHLFVSEIPEYEAAELVAFKSVVKEKMVDVNSIHQHLTEGKSTLDNIEGIWTDGDSKYAIIKNPSTAWSFEYVAVILSHAQPDKVGELKFGVSRKENQLEGIYYTNNYAPAYTRVELVKENSMLSIWGGRFWRRIPFTDEASISNAKLFNPTLPTVSILDAETTLLSIPTFLVEKKDFDAVLMNNYKALSETKYLIIDIRGNGGGNGIYFDLLSLFADRTAPAEVGLALASADNMAYFERFGNGSVYSPVVKDMKKSMGQIVDGPRYSALKIKSMKSNIHKVAILTDDANMSAAESFILHAKGVSSKVITIGKNTRGVIDYQSINMIKLDCEKQGLYFGYPTSTSTKGVPAKGYNKTGIAPDVLTHKVGKDLIDFAVKSMKQ
jgi:Peptidase family S41